MNSANNLYHRLVRKGYALTSKDGQHLEIRPASRLDETDRQQIRRHKQELLSLIQQGCQSGVETAHRTITASPGRRRQPVISFQWGDEQITANRYERKQGRVFHDWFSLDCETELITPQAIPKLALVGVSDGKTHFFIHPEDLGCFVQAQADTQVVFHNVAFDFWVVHKHLTDRGERDAVAAWVKLAKQRHLHDTMLLDMLLALAAGVIGGDDLRPRDLGVVTRQYAGLEIDKEDPYRMRYGEIIGRDWTKVEPGFFEYAIKDPIGTARAYIPMRKKAQEYMAAAGFDPQATDRFSVLPDAIQRFGVLTEEVQASAGIALDAISRTGISVNMTQLSRLRGEYKQLVEHEFKELNRTYPGIFKLDERGRPIPTPRTGTPSKSDAKLKEYLLRAVKETENQTGEAIEVPKTKKGHISTSVELWEPFIGQHHFLELLSRYSKAAKRSGFLQQLDAEVVHPRYGILKRTGRTGCSKPNMQQVPREDEFREMIIASAGYLLLAVDYKYIELVTLAAICLSRFGKSRLAQIICQGIDPHCFTAAMLLSMTYDEFMQLKKSQPEEFKRWRQMAKPVNFGVPGGMGPKSLKDYAKKTFGVDMSLEEAQEFHRRLVEEIYPELKLYLADNSMVTLAKNLETCAEELWTRLDARGERSAAVPGGIRKVVEGIAFKADGTPYQDAYIERVWDVLNEVNQSVEFAVPLMSGVGSKKLADRLFFTAIPTLTGRVRGGVIYTSERNTQFQGLASDGAKLALARLVLNDYRVVGFIHDEILVELIDEGGFVSRAVVQHVVNHICEGMKEVTCGIPVECEYTVSTCWSKRAKLIEDGDRIIAWSPAQEKR